VSKNHPTWVPPVTVVTVTYDDLAGLRRSVDSLRRQTHRDFQHVVIDGGSTDGSMDWLIAHPGSDNSVAVSEPDEGIYDAMNKGLQIAKGELVTFLNAGDTYADPDVLARVIQHHRDHHWEWGHGLARIVDGGGQQVRPLGDTSYNRWRHAFGRNSVVHQTVFVRTSVLRSLGGFDVTFPVAADFHTVLRLARISRPGLWADVDVEFLVGGLSDRRFALALWDMHRARCDVFRLRGPVRALDAMWWAGLVVYVQGRRVIKRSAQRLGGQRAVSWWIHHRAGRNSGV